MKSLEKSLRRKLESTVKEARDVAEEAAKAVVEQLEVGAATPKRKLDDGERQLRNRLRAHGRQLGDVRSDKGEQETERLLEEIAYQHWHRMLFARFLAENELLMYPDPDDPVAVTLGECEDLAADEGARNGWELAAKFAAKMLPQIFRVDSPVFALELPTEKQHKLEQMLTKLSSDVFTASDSLGWVYQFWQTKRKRQINDSEVKIGARELPAVTQLFTEPYMVSFLLDNSLGAWWAARRLTADDVRNAKSEQELRDKAALPGVPLEYLRFIWDDGTDSDETSQSGGSLFDQQKPEDNPSFEPRIPQWQLAAGTFDAWPESLSELKMLDPCCGSGHFLVAALLMLTPVRMELEGLSANEAVDRVLCENLHGLEIDQRCVELAAFALALTAWRFPEAGGYRVLPDLNVACCGLSVSVAKEEWMELARDNKQLRIALDWMYDEFNDGPILGSLLNPAKSLATTLMKWSELLPILQNSLATKRAEPQSEAAIVAHGLSRAVGILAEEYNWVATNVPYLKRGKHSTKLKAFCESDYDDAKNDLATAMVDRCVRFSNVNGTSSLVVPQNWLYLASYSAFRRRMLKSCIWHSVIRLGPSAFSTISGEVVKAVLLSFSNCPVSATPVRSSKDLVWSTDRISVLDVSDIGLVEEKAKSIAKAPMTTISQKTQLSNPDSRITFDDVGGVLLETLGAALNGMHGADSPRFRFSFWEVREMHDWRWLQNTVDETTPFGGRSQIFYWRNEGAVHAENANARIQGTAGWGKCGIAVSMMGDLQSTLFTGDFFDISCSPIIPLDRAHCAAIWCFCSSPVFNEVVRDIDQSLKVTNGTLVKVPFDLAYWQQVASKKYPHGLLEPYSDDPTQWLFHGHPSSSTDALQVAVARLLGYRWPAELDEEMELATDARRWMQASSKLNSHADDDGIVCLPAIGPEAVADERLLNLLNEAFEDGRAVEAEFQQKLDVNDTSDPLTLDLLRRGWQPTLPDNFNNWLAACLKAVGHADKTLSSWLRDKFFTQHCKLFHHRPFIWQIWDGVKDGFSVLVNYHRFDNKLLETLIYTHLNDWIKTQKSQVGKVDGSEEKLAAAEKLKRLLEKIREGESPHDIFVRWKPLEEQPIGWNPDLNDGVRLNIRPFMTVGDVGKAGAGILRDKPNCKWTKDRGKDVESAPWYHLGPKYGGKPGDRINDHHLKLADKQTHANGSDS